MRKPKAFTAEDAKDAEGNLKNLNIVSSFFCDIIIVLPSVSSVVSKKGI